jgi:predicted acyl esterase
MTAVIDQFPRKVREIENEWITMPDGCRLAARIWLPEDAEDDPVPAILEYLPYRKRDGTIERDHLTHPYFAGHGYACVRVDMRGQAMRTACWTTNTARRNWQTALR